MSVEVQSLTKKYGKQIAVNNLSFSAQKGDILGFLGPNGAGKSTTMKIITCCLPPDAGEVSVCGYSVNTASAEVRKRVGYLPEHNPMYLEMYIAEYLEFCGSLHHLKGAKLASRVKEMVALTGLEKEKNKKIGALSKGYRQRVGLAQALIHDPEVLILDEPTSGLDPNQIVEIRNLIREMAKQKTVIFSTHIMQEAEQVCNRILILHAGILVADRKLEQLNDTPSHVKTILLQFDVPVNTELLRSLSQVTAVQDLNAGKYRLSPEHGRDIRPDIVKLAAAHNLNLLEMKQEEHSLEDIFRNLTQNGEVK